MIREAHILRNMADDAAIAIDALESIKVEASDGKGFATERYILEKAQVAKRCIDYIISEAEK